MLFSYTCTNYVALAQLGERLPYKQNVGSSSLSCDTMQDA